MEKSLFHAILALDAYNRGYDADINGLASTKNTLIGDARIISTSTVFGEDVDSSESFYAIAYEYNGQKVISYRGTDNLSSDPITGWGVGRGASRSPQALLASDFYKAVIGKQSPYDANVIFTGHSLGGGLAGLMGSLYGKEAYIFNNMPFELAAEEIFSASVELGYEDFELSNHYYFNGATPNPPNQSKIHAYATRGEFLTPLRAFQDTPVDYLQSHAYEGSEDLHSQALLVLLLHARIKAEEEGLGTEWQHETVAKFFIDAMFEDNIAVSFENDSSKMLTAIAYSAIEEGEKPFGDTAIHALFDDANELGEALMEQKNLFSVLEYLFMKAYVQHISKVLVQHAGLLAFNKIESEAFADAIKGVVEFDTTVNNKLLTVSFDNELWRKTNGGTPVETIEARDDLVNQVLEHTGSAVTSIKTAMRELWGNDTPAIIDRIVFAVLENGDLTNNNKYDHTLYVGRYDGNDTVTGSNENDLLLGNFGIDTLRGESGRDILVAGNGDDTLEGGGDFDAYIFTKYGGGQDIINDSDGEGEIIFTDETKISGEAKLVKVIDTEQFLFEIDENGVQLSYNPKTSSLMIYDWDGNSGNDSITIEEFENGNLDINLLTEIDAFDDNVFTGDEPGEGFDDGSLVIELLALNNDKYIPGSVWISEINGIPTEKDGWTVFKLDDVFFIQIYNDPSGISLPHMGLGHPFIANSSFAYGFEITYKLTSLFDNNLFNTATYRQASYGYGNQPLVRPVEKIFPIEVPDEDETVGGTWFDPHLVTFDNYGYSFQTVGEFTLFAIEERGLEVQVRQSALGESASVNTAMAIKAGSQTASIYSVGSSSELYVGDTLLSLNNGEDVTINGMTIARANNLYTFTTDGNDKVQVDVRNGFLNITPIIVDGDEQVTGLLGNANGIRNDEFTLRNGTVLENVTTSVIYNEFANSWRITNDTSLFRYADGESTETFTDLNFPENIKTLADFTAEEIQAAENIVKAQGVNSGFHFNNAVLDILLTGNPEFAEGIAEFENPIVDIHSNMFPNAFNDTNTTDEATIITGNVLTNDTDENDDTLTVAEVNGFKSNIGKSFTTSKGGLITLNADGSYEYNPNGAFDALNDGATAADTIEYKMTDGNGGFAEATLQITIEGVGTPPVTNTAPVANDDTNTTDEATIITGNVLTNDTDENDDTLTVAEVNGFKSNVGKSFTTSKGGLITLNADGSYEYNPNGAFDALNDGASATDSFNYEASDNNGGFSTATVTITINGVNEEVFGNIINGTDIKNNLFGLAFDDIINGLGGDDRINGRDGDDIIYGGLGHDFIAGDHGNDIIYGNEGNDTLEGRLGDDILYGGIGEDKLAGGDGDDALYGDEGNDFIHGNHGNDIIAGGNGDDTIIGSRGNDTLYGQAGNDNIRGDEGDDIIEGGLGNDILEGRLGDDTLYGDAGDDIIYGNSGLDTIIGGLGADQLWGDTIGGQKLNIDTFVYLTNQDSIVGSSDVIHGFTTGFDKIDISALGITAENLVINSVGNFMYEVSTLNSYDLFLMVETYGKASLQDNDFVLAA